MYKRTHHLYFAVITLTVLAVIAVLLLRHEAPKTNAPSPTPMSAAQTESNTTPEITPTPTVAPKPELIAPIAEFKKRITKKPFAIKVSPGNSPTIPEHFTGYHLAVDVEYDDVVADVPVGAITTGTVVGSQVVKGYGGVMLIHHTIAGVEHTVLYGHLRPSSMLAVATPVSRGQKIGVLGTAYSSETDGERRHLHFSVLSNDRIDYKGYVQSVPELDGWIDPMNLTYED